MRETSMWLIQLRNPSFAGDGTDEFPKFREFGSHIPGDQLVEELTLLVNNQDHKDPAIWHQALRGLLEVPIECSDWSISNGRPLEIEVDESLLRWRIVHIESEEMWYFFYSPSEGDKFRYVPIPEGCVINESGRITCLLDEYAIAVDPKWSDNNRPEDWPWVLLNPRAWIALRQFEKVMARSDTNPLTILLRSGYPTKGNALQLKGKIEDVLGMFTRALSGDRL
ncbi:MAG: hypothetical protein A3I39_00015 [Candidatus Yanofskybacteria bacterium RIFCSPLOWO2_02_FULL_47_9b]|uniref:Uncharacterized protein n=1 Tax=Candidatus Yanofskybacteria bacterium RIFCSPLOWO2_02_FULL_47_9b TaxID=1802708 RepID=A0A1F8H9N6_9BACT|nr:MAG: hypothetical protein A3I39_00015 [Candidatus Yanofskybacteria bacterium RIFCSPLOWO2_02_FULL_47_9b]